MMRYTIRRTAVQPEAGSGFDDAPWRLAETGRIDQFHPKSTAHHPRVSFRLLCHQSGLCLKYAAHDRYVRATKTRFQDFVCADSCVEFLVRPANARGYISFEMNCIGTLLSYHILDPARGTPPRIFRDYRPLTGEELAGFEIQHTFSGITEAEVTAPVYYEVTLFIPFQVFSRVFGIGAPESGAVWKGNFFKCADESSHPHWASWSPLGAELNFHTPEYFQELYFE